MNEHDVQWLKDILARSTGTIYVPEKDGQSAIRAVDVLRIVESLQDQLTQVRAEKERAEHHARREWKRANNLTKRVVVAEAAEKREKALRDAARELLKRIPAHSLPRPGSNEDHQQRAADTLRQLLDGAA